MPGLKKLSQNFKAFLDFKISRKELGVPGDKWAYPEYLEQMWMLVLNLLAALKSEFNLTYLFISHDLAVVEAVCDRIVVLYFGAVVEIGKAEVIFNAPKHPYTRLLAESAPVVGRPLKAPEQKDSELPDPLNPPPGCAFAGRCPRATDICRTEDPALTQMKENQFAACHHPLED